MRQLLLLFFCFSSTLSIAQFEYSELPGNKKEVAHIYHAFEDGTLLAITDNPQNFHISHDIGETWNTLDKENHNISFAFARYHMDLNGVIYISYENKIYKLNEASHTFEVVLENNNFDDIFDFGFLPDGNIIVAEDRMLKLYSSDWQLIKEHDWWTHGSKILMGEGNKHYAVTQLGASFRILYFNSDLSFVSSETHIPDIYNGIYYSEDRLLISNSYSDDGGSTWVPYAGVGNAAYNIFNVEGSRVMVLKGADFFLSEDNGDTFELFDLEEIDNSNRAWLHSSNGMTFSTLLNDEGSIKTTYDKGVSFEVQNMNFGLEYANDVEVNDDGFAFVRYKQSLARYNPNTDHWSQMEENGCGFRSVLSLANSTLISGYFGCISADNGETWQLDDYDIFQSFYDLVDKNEVLYEDEYYFIRSLDYGITWEEYTFPGLPEHVYDAAVTGEGNVIYREWDFYAPETWTLYYQDGHSADLDFTPDINKIHTAYSGPTVYLMTGNYLGDSLWVSYSGHDNFQLVDMPDNVDKHYNVEIDFLNNLYVFDDTNLFISRDEGTNWEDISPTHSDISKITNLDLGHDLHLYISTFGTSILKSVEPISEVNTIEVVVFNDMDGDCVYDEDQEPIINGIKATLNERQTKETTTHSKLQFKSIYDENSIELDIDSELFDVCDYEYEIIFDQGQKEKTIYVPVSIAKVCSDIELSASTTLLRRCFDNRYYINVQNSGTEISENVQLEVLLDDYFLFESCNFPILEIDGQNLLLDIGDIELFEKKTIHIDFTLSCEAELGQAHYMNAQVKFDNACTEVDVAESFECRQNIGSYDPNDKTALVGGVADNKIVPLDEPIEYLIRFQNTGTDTAFTVRIEDTLSHHFELSTIEVVSSSHDYTYNITRGILNVTFDDILLPDSTTNEKKSHGFVKFTIKPKESTHPGTYIKNKANIYFDFNEPVLTNGTGNYYLCKNQYVSLTDTICPGEDFYGYTESGTYFQQELTTFGCDSYTNIYLTVLEEFDAECMTSSTFDFDKGRDIILYPNPSNGRIFIYSKDVVVSNVTLRALDGRLIETIDVIDNQVNFDVATGVYLLECHTSANGKVMKKVVISH